MRAGYSVIIISDRRVNRDNVAIPALLALSATAAGGLVDTGAYAGAVGTP